MARGLQPTLILGGGVTGLAAGIASGLPVYEAEPHPGGVCASYYLRRGSTQRMSGPGDGGDVFRFEHGGGHWIFGGHPDVLSIVEQLAPCARIERRSGVYFPDQRRRVGFPLQHHLRELDRDLAAAALAEMLAARPAAAATMAAWLDSQFGPTLGELFFRPFHDAYTAGLWREIAPQDGYKTPLDLAQIVRGAFAAPAPAGYNATFLYPHGGLDALVGALAARVDLHAGRRVVAIDLTRRELAFADGARLPWRRLLATLPLNRLLELTGLADALPPDPHTSVLVVNIGARRGPACPDDHWLYVPKSASGFHRVGCYSHVAEHFLPVADRGRGSAVSLYVERSYRGGERPDAAAVAEHADAVVRELQDWGFIGAVDVVDPTWVDVAYTWARPGSGWTGAAIAALAAHDIRVAGRYARWSFQGITDSLRDGFLAGQALRLGE